MKSISGRANLDAVMLIGPISRSRRPCSTASSPCSGLDWGINLYSRSLSEAKDFQTSRLIPSWSCPFLITNGASPAKPTLSGLAPRGQAQDARTSARAAADRRDVTTENAASNAVQAMRSVLLEFLDDDSHCHQRATQRDQQSNGHGRIKNKSRSDRVASATRNHQRGELSPQSSQR